MATKGYIYSSCYWGLASLALERLEELVAAQRQEHNDDYSTGLRRGQVLAYGAILRAAVGTDDLEKAKSRMQQTRDR